MAKKKRSIPAINSSASADIAFLLLIFFLITSSLDPNTGIYQRLSPIAAEETLKKGQDIQDRNLLTYTIDGDNRILYKEEPVSLANVAVLSKTFISNPNRSEFLPELIDTEIPLAGLVPVTANHIISIEFAPESKYETYIALLNEIIGTYNELRAETAEKLFGKPIEKLSEEEIGAIMKIYPLRVTEKETGKETSL